MKLFMLLGALLFGGMFLVYSDDSNPGGGETIFQRNCSSCHTIGKGDLAGPDLKGVKSRRSEEWLFQFIKSPKKLIKKGDKTALDLYNKYNQIVMPDQKLDDVEIQQVLDYIESME
jgi:protein SCO1